jgi:hypothetical protein
MQLRSGEGQPGDHKGTEKPFGREGPDNMTSTEIDIFEFSQRGEEVPHASAYRVRIDGEVFRIDTPTPKGELLLDKVGKRPCAFELIEEFVHGKNDVVEPEEEVDLRKPGLKGFITAHKEIVTIFINGDPYKIERGDRTVAEILARVGQTPEGQGTARALLFRAPPLFFWLAVRARRPREKRMMRGFSYSPRSPWGPITWK